MAFPVVDGLRTMEIGSVGEMRERLNGLILAGEKRATAGLVQEYEDEPFEHTAVSDSSSSTTSCGALASWK